MGATQSGISSMGKAEGRGREHEVPGGFQVEVSGAGTPRLVSGARAGQWAVKSQTWGSSRRARIWGSPPGSVVELPVQERRPDGGRSPRTSPS